MSIKEITCYQNDDGHIWTTLAQAEFWELVTSKVKKGASKTAAEVDYNMRNEGYESSYHPIGRD